MKKTKLINKEPLRGEKLAKAVVNQILGHPETWYQAAWHHSCGTKHCFGGWCQILGGRKINVVTASEDAKELLEISESEARVLFRADCSLGELYSFAKNYSAGRDRAGRDRAGFDRAGFDRAGFDRDGIDRAGFDRAGIDRAGFDRAGFDRAGRDRAGFDRAGFDRDGIDRAGFDRAGFDRAGRDRDGNKLPLFEL